MRWHFDINIIADRSHSIHFVAIDKTRMAAEIGAAPGTFFDLKIPYLLGFNYLASYIQHCVDEEIVKG